ncbi:MAG: CBS domain-containing protein, partial [Rhodoferax sp.]|nr:CBS domain-containing protein [Rhodoferax sp.]
MFSVYGTTGQLFRGSMEQLQQVGGVGALARSRHSQPVARDGRDLADDPGGAFLPDLKRPAPRAETHHDALAAYAQSETHQRHPLSTVADLMSRQIITLSSSASVLQAWQLLAEQGVGQAPVVNEQGLLVGLLTRADLMKTERLPTPDAHALVWRALMQQNVQDIMWTPVPSVAPESDIRRVVRVLLDTGFPGLPVVDEVGTVIGFISRSDIL